MSLASFRYVLGLGKQATFNTGVTATTFPRWGTGTDINPDLKTVAIDQGDNTPAYALVLKEVQGYRGKIIGQHLRSIDLGFMLQALNGSGSDGTASNGLVGTAGSKTGTVGALSAGATTATYTLTGGTAPIIGDVMQIDVNSGSTTAEIVTLTNVTGGGPYTLTWVGGLLYSHAGAAACNNTVAPYTHTFVPQLTHNYFTIYAQYQLATAEALKVVDCKINKMTIEGIASKPLKIDFDFVGLTGSDITTSIGTVTYDTSTSNPYVYYGGTFSVDGTTTGTNAPYVKRFKLTHDFSLDEQQTEAVTLADVIAANRVVDFEYDVLWQDTTQFKKAYYNAGASDSAVVGTGALDLTFFAGGDTTQTGTSFEIIASTLHYESAKLPLPTVEGKAFIQMLKGKAVTNPEVKYKLKNTQTTTF